MGKETMRFVVDRQTLEKGVARGGKYYRRTPTGNPKRPWRYYYTRADYEQAHGEQAHVSGSEVKQSRQKLPDSPWRYFHKTPGAQLIPVSKLLAARARPEGIANAAAHMQNAFEGKGEKRKPISLRANGDGTFTVLDGNSTTAMARAADWKHIVGRVEPAHTPAQEKRHAYLEKMKGTVQSFRAALASGKLQGTLGEHVRTAKKTLDKHHATLPKLISDLQSHAPKGAKIKARVKALESALGKLDRKPKYGTTANLQDSTGGRVVCNSIAEVEATVANLKRAYKVVTEDDYISSHLDGYRSYHLIIEHEGLQKEIQVRTKNQDTWADFAHDIYKPMTPKQEKALVQSKAEIKEYSAKLSEYIYAKDLGKKPPPPILPKCPDVIPAAFGGCPSV